MPVAIEAARVRECLQRFELQRLFIEELGWDRHHAQTEITVDGSTCCLRALAQKRGMIAFEACPEADASVPDYATRRKIEREVAKIAHEHLVVYTDPARTTQIWQWVRREPGRPTACREHTYHKGQPGDALIQKLQWLAIGLDEEESLTVVDVAGRVRRAFDVDRVTRRFYDVFKTEHAAFLRLIRGIDSEADREWYASLMLNRLMFIYFIQKKGFLDGDPDYLRNRLQMMQQRKKKDQFLSFYRHFLLRLFHEGLGQEQHSPELDELLGRVPYLNGGLFDVHELEEANPELRIPDEAFARLFDFFSEWNWHLDERPLRADNEINPDVLGYIFEKYVNQKQMGAYYTKEDITGYIARNTIIPFLFDAAEKACAIAFRPDSVLWRLLRNDPDRYIWPAVRHGVDIPLPPDIEAGIAEIPKRTGWNRAAPPEYALPTETWREHIARRQRCHQVRAKLAAGEVHAINDLITLNLDICQFAQDVIESCEGPELLRAFWKALQSVTVLDPTCGSGAFLFAALNILEPLYEACLTRMEAFVGDLERSGEKHHPEKFGDFRKVLAHVAEHPNHRYFILKSIIVGNLFGVDIMEEAVEICKLRLFLKLAAQVERFEDLEPLPDIDFNIRAGNTLVGFASYEEVQRSLASRLDFEDALPRITEQAELADRAFRRFREMQTEHGMDAADFHDAKAELRRRLDSLRGELDRHLASEYGIDPGNEAALARWQASHQPFHWFVEFYGIIHGGGFDVVIGNPPYVEYSKVRGDYTIRGYETEPCGNLYALIAERCLELSRQTGRTGLIVPLSAFATERMTPMVRTIEASVRALWLSNYAIRPCKLFEGVEFRLAIAVLSLGHAETITRWSSRYTRWYAQVRDRLMPLLEYERASLPTARLPALPKAGTPVAASILEKLFASPRAELGLHLLRNTGPGSIFYQEATGYWVKATSIVPFYEKNGERLTPAHSRMLYLAKARHAAAACAVMNSSTFFLYFNLLTDCYHLSDTAVRAFPLPDNMLDNTRLHALNAQLMERLAEDADVVTMRTRDGHTIRLACFKYTGAKPIIDEIDRVLAEHYGFTEEELDFIINYDIKYRMGGAEGEEGEDAD